MLEWANRLITLAYVVEKDPQGNVLLNPDGTPMLKLGPTGKVIKNPANPGAAGALQKYVDQIDLFRQLVTTFQHPLDEWSLPQP